MTLSVLRYLCTKSHFDGVQQFEAGKIYLFPVDPGTNFTVTTADPLESNIALTHTDSDGTIYFAGNVANYDDWSFPLSQSKQGSNLKPDYDFTNNGYLFPQNDTDEVLYMTDVTSHRMQCRPGVMWYPHIHFQQSGEDIPVFEYRIKLQAAGAAAPSWTGWLATTGDLVFDAGELHQILTFPTFDAYALGFTSVACICDIQLRRNDNVVTGDVLAKQFDFHVPFDAPLGSGQQFIK